MTTVVHTFYQKQLALKSYFDERWEISLSQDIEETFRKALALAAGSYFETEVCLTLENFARAKSSNDELIVSFIKNKALARQYHSFFVWESSNANTFLGLFGTRFRDQVKLKIDGSEVLKKSLKDFLEIGNLRNRAAHQNFAAFTTDKTSEEIFQTFESALGFLAMLKAELN